MTYIQGFVVAVPAANRDAYKDYAQRATPLVKEYGVARLVEAWGDDVPDGKVTDFKRAVKAEGDEVVVFGWWEFPSKAARDAANKQMMSDPRMEQLGAMPFDGKRMIYGGFDAIVDETGQGTSGYADGYIVPVPNDKKEAYRALAAMAAEVFKDHGATRVVEAWGDDVPDGKVTDFRRAVQAKDNESVVFSYVEWPDKAARTAGWEKVMRDPRMDMDMKDSPFDAQRMVWGGFAPLLDE